MRTEKIHVLDYANNYFLLYVIAIGVMIHFLFFFPRDGDTDSWILLINKVHVHTQRTQVKELKEHQPPSAPPPLRLQ